MNSKIMLCSNIKLEKDYKDVLTYTESQMVTLCTTKAKASKTNYQFIRKEKNTILVDIAYSTCLQCNYMAFQNTDYSNKWFFAFIDDVEFVSPNSTKIRYTVDEFSTWFDYWNPQSCFVLREHTMDDTIGNNTLPEGLETGEFVINSTDRFTTRLDSTYTCIGVTWLPSNSDFYTDNRVYGGVYSGVSYILFRTIDSAAKFIRAIDEIGRDSSATILSISEIPQYITGVNAADFTVADLGDETDIGYHVLPNVLVSNILTNYTISNLSTLNGYTPKNNKLFTGEFNKLLITNNAGQQAEFHYEDFINNTPTFNIDGCPSASCSIWLYPVNYKKNSTAGAGYHWGMSIGKYPIGSWNSDPYTNWLTSNGVNILGHQIDAPTYQAAVGSIQALIGGLQLGAMGGMTESEASAASSGMGSNIGGGFAKMFGAVQSDYQHSLTPHTVNGQLNSGDIQFASNKMSPVWYKMSVRYEFAKRIDDWFSRFGYKTNELKLPNQIGRTYYNYVQIGATENIGYSTNISYSVPSTSMEVINNIYRNGVTLWHSHDNLGDYSLNNTIISQ